MVALRAMLSSGALVQHSECDWVEEKAHDRGHYVILAAFGKCEMTALSFLQDLRSFSKRAAMLAFAVELTAMLAEIH
jgi:hypothetical protein